MERVIGFHQLSARQFIKYCTDKFGWSDLSNDVIMDVGCGENMFCGKSVIEKFPNVRKIIGIDVDPEEVQKCQLKDENIECVIADIQNRETLQKYEGKMNKVVSTHAFHQLFEKEEALQNVYHLLQPGGEAAILFVVSTLMYEWLIEMNKDPKWKALYKRHYVEDLYPSGHGTDHYKEMANRIGFRVLDTFEEIRIISYSNDQVCKDSLHTMLGYTFEVPPESLEEFKKESFETLLKIGGRDEQGRPSYRSTELSLLLVKPTAASSSDPKELES